VSGLKILGKEHVQQAINNFRESFQSSKLIVGFDLVNEEDFCPPLKEFLPMLFDEFR
jgi:hypothetical protein